MYRIDICSSIRPVPPPPKKNEKLLLNSETKFFKLSKAIK